MELESKNQNKNKIKFDKDKHYTNTDFLKDLKKVCRTTKSVEKPKSTSSKT